MKTTPQLAASNLRNITTAWPGFCGKNIIDLASKVADKLQSHEGPVTREVVRNAIDQVNDLAPNELQDFLLDLLDLAMAPSAESIADESGSELKKLQAKLF